jgi:hypothetical protein
MKGELLAACRENCISEFVGVSKQYRERTPPVTKVNAGVFTLFKREK